MAVKNGLYALLSTTSSVSSLIAAAPNSGAGTGLYFSLAPKQALRPYIVIHLVNGPPAAKTLSGSSSLIKGRFQFDSYADDPTIARQVSQAIRTLLQDFSSALPDGTTITFTAVHADMDDAFETGGVGYLYRSMLDMEGFYDEGGGSAPPAEGNLTRYSFTPAPDGTTTTFTAPVAISANALVIRNGSVLSAGNDYSYSGNEVTFFIAPGADDVIELYQ